MILKVVTIVGMRFYKGAHEYLYSIKDKDIKDQCLYLVPELDNDADINAIMLRNGKQKLGSVSASQAPYLKKLFQNWQNDNSGSNDVIVCEMRIFDHGLDFFRRTGSISVKGVYRVNERLARKFSAI